MIRFIFALLFFSSTAFAQTPESVKAQIDSQINSNSRAAITGSILNSVLTSNVNLFGKYIPASVTNVINLSAYSTLTYSFVTLYGYTTAGDTPPVLYYASSSACSLNGGNGDGRSQVKSADSKCWLANAGAEDTVLRIVSGAPAWSPDVKTAVAGSGVAVSGATGNVTFSLAPIAAGLILSNVTGGSATPVGNSVSSVLDRLSTTQGSVLYRDASNWVALSPGTSGQFLRTNGAAANPSWAGGGAGTVTQVTCGIGLTGGVFTTSGTCAYDTGNAPGIATNTGAVAGKVGEVVASSLSQGSRVTATSATPINVTSISLTAGDWDIRANAQFDFSAASTVNSQRCSISTTSATQSIAPESNSYSIAISGSTSAVTNTASIPSYQILLSVTTTYYLVCQGNFSASGFFWGSISARRMR